MTRSHGFACYLTGLIYVNAGNDTAALPFYDRALALNPSYGEALEGRARIMHRAGRFKEAIADYDALFRTRPANAEALCNLGAAYEGIGQPAEAMRCYNLTLEASPDYAPALAAKALLLYDEGHLEDALEMLRASIAAGPSNGNAWYNCGVIHAACAEHAEAYNCFATALRLLPGFGKALYGAATALQTLGRFGEALAVCGELLSQAPSDFEALFLCGNILYEMRRLSEALAAFDQALAQNPRHAALFAIEERRFASWDASQKRAPCSTPRSHKIQFRLRRCSDGALSSSKARGSRRRLRFSKAPSMPSLSRRPGYAGAAWRCSTWAGSARPRGTSNARSL